MKDCIKLNYIRNIKFFFFFFYFSLGYAFHVGSQLRGEVSSIFERIEDAIVQADEVDGRMLQFEGGLSITGKSNPLSDNYHPYHRASMWNGAIESGTLLTLYRCILDIGSSLEPMKM